MKTKFNLTRNSDGLLIGTSDEDNYALAAHQILAIPFAFKGVEVEKAKIKIEPVSDTEFSVLFEGDKYTLRKLA